MSVWDKIKKEEEKVPSKIVSKPQESITVRDTDDENIKEVVITDVDELGRKRITTRKIRKVKKVKKVNKFVLDREKWKPFGIAAMGKFISYEQGGEREIETVVEIHPLQKIEKHEVSDGDKIIESLVKKYGKMSDTTKDGEDDNVYIAPTTTSHSFRNKDYSASEENTTLRISNINERVDKRMLEGIAFELLKEVRMKTLRSKRKQHQELDEKYGRLHEKREKKKKTIQMYEKRLKQLQKQAEEEKRNPPKETPDADDDTGKKNEKEGGKKKEDTAKLISTAKVRFDKSKRQYKQVHGEMANLEQKIMNLTKDIQERDREAYLFPDPREVIRRIVINYDRRDDGYYAFLRFDRKDDARGVLETIVQNETSIDKCIMKVEWARPRRY